MYIYLLVRPSYLIAEYKQPKHEFEEISKDCEMEATFQVLTELGEISSSLA